MSDGGDQINPDHYRFPHAEVIAITEGLPFCRGNVIKYVARAGRKDGGEELTDLRKAQWYLEREIIRMLNASAARLKRDSALAPDEERYG